MQKVHMAHGWRRKDVIFHKCIGQFFPDKTKLYLRWELRVGKKFALFNLVALYRESQRIFIQKSYEAQKLRTLQELPEEKKSSCNY